MIFFLDSIHDLRCRCSTVGGKVSLSLHRGGSLWHDAFVVMTPDEALATGKALIAAACSAREETPAEPAGIPVCQTTGD